MSFIVLGGYGIIGRAVTEDLFRITKEYITIAGRDLKKAKIYASSFKSPRVKAIKVDINNVNDMAKILKKFRVCINCVQYYYNLNIMRSCLASRTNYVDLGGMFHMTREQLRLHKKFKEIKKVAILGCGGAPGISNILAKYGGQFLNKIKSIEIVFADYDKTNYGQKFVLPYSFKTLIEEYTLKPAVLRNGEIMFVKPRSGQKEYSFKGMFGRQKAFLTLHSEIATLPRYFKERGIKNCEFRITFPEDFSKKINSLIKTGFASKDFIGVNGKNLSIIDVTTKMMDMFIPRQGIKINDKEIIRIILNRGKIVVDAITTSDGRTQAGTLDTAIPCSVAAQMIVSQQITEYGVFAPENVINPDLFFKELRNRGITIYKNGGLVN